MDLESSRKELDKIYENASTIGIGYSDLLLLDIRKYNCFIEGYITRRETVMNDMKLVGHLVAGKVGASLVDGKEFSKPIKDIRLREKDVVKDRQERVIQTLRAKGVI